MAYNLTKEQIKELIKLYPKIKIPCLEYSEYYLNCLSETMPEIEYLVSELKRCEEENSANISSYKHKKFDEIIEFFKPKYLEKFVNLSLKAYKSNYPKSFNNWKEDKWYLSLDLREANWSIFKNVLNLDLPIWEEFSINEFNLYFIPQLKWR